MGDFDLIAEPDDAPTWHSQREAQRLFEDAVRESGGWNYALLDDLALSWRNSTAVHMDRLRHTNLKQFRDAMGDDIRSHAVFASAASNSVQAVCAEVTLTKDGKYWSSVRDRSNAASSLASLGTTR